MTGRAARLDQLLLVALILSALLLAAVSIAAELAVTDPAAPPMTIPATGSA